MRCGHKLPVTASEDLPLSKIMGDVVAWFFVHDKEEPTEDLIETSPPVTKPLL